MKVGAGRVKSVKAGTAPGIAVLGHGLTFLDSPEDTDDGFFLWQCSTPAGGGVPPHSERNHEAFYVLEGTFEIEADGSLFSCAPGDFLGVAPGVVHSFRNPGPGWARMLTIVSPGSQHQRFFEALGEPLEPGALPAPLAGPPDFERVASVGRGSGIDFLPPEEAAVDD